MDSGKIDGQRWRWWRQQRWALVGIAMGDGDGGGTIAVSVIGHGLALLLSGTIH